MSKLRKKLQQARHEYQHQRYPGDLANDLLGRADVVAQITPAKKPSHWVRNLALAAALAIVATAGIVLLKQGAKPADEVAVVTPPDPTAVNPPTTQQTDVAPTDLANGQTETNSEEEVEERWSLVPSGIASSQEMSFSLVPSMSYASTSVGEPETETTTQQ